MHRPTHRSRPGWVAALCAAGLLTLPRPGKAAEPLALPDFTREVQPLLNEFCSDCHADGMNKGNVAFDELPTDGPVPGSPELWLAVLKNLRAGIMPPSRKPQPTAEQKKLLETWIKRGAFELDPQNPDPGRVTVRRLNRVEYRNTIRDLVGVDYRTDEEFPADDTGHGFDNLADVLTLSPLLLEKYLAAARVIVEQAVPQVPWVPAERVLAGQSFRKEAGSGSEDSRSLSYYEEARVTNAVEVSKAGRYQLLLNLTASERFVDNVFDYNRCRLRFTVDGQEVLEKEFGREGGRTFRFEFDRDWDPGEHVLAFELTPLTPEEKQVRSLALRLNSVTLRGPLEREEWVRPQNYERFFPRDTPDDPAERRAYAAEILSSFARQAYRRPVGAETVDRLLQLAEGTYQQPGKTFEAGISQAMVAVLASPRFLFREELLEPSEGRERDSYLDQHALAARLSYFLWSSMPDAELFRLADEGRLRENLSAQLQRLLADSKSAAFIQNFTGQWLQARDIDSVTIDSRSVLQREEMPDPDQDRKRSRFRELRNRDSATLSAEETEELNQLRTELFRSFSRPRAELTGDLRRAMRRETEMTFEHVIREDRSVRELIDSDYTFLNEVLARHYGLTNLTVTGGEMQKVTLPPDSPRGGVLTQGTVLAVTSNPTRTSPVKRGVFILDNILGTPPPPPPPDIPALEDAGKQITDRTPTLRETLELHRAKAVCSSCHDRMDPLGLALENFNAMGMWREQERGTPVDVTGRLITGEAFTNIRELKRILANERQRDFYYCLTEKLLTYALGRGLDHRDVETLDQLVERLEAADGRPSALLQGIVESAAFQKRRNPEGDPEESFKPAKPTGQRAGLKNKP